MEDDAEYGHQRPVSRSAPIIVSIVAGIVSCPGIIHADMQQRPEQTNSLSIDGKAGILDADTLLLNNEKIQLFGVIAPELTTPLGRSAQEWLSERLQGRSVHCEPMSAPGIHPVVARCWREGTDISEELLRGGFGLTDLTPVMEGAGKEDLVTKYEMAEREARFGRTGMWSDEPITFSSELKDWQTLLAGLFAIVAAWIALYGINKQIRAVQKTEAERLASEKAALTHALSAELQAMLQYIQEQHKKLLEADGSVAPARLAQALPTAFPLFNAAAARLGLLDADATAKIFYAYHALTNFAKEIEIMQIGEPEADIAVVEGAWPGSAFDECIKCTEQALKALRLR